MLLPCCRAAVVSSAQRHLHVRAAHFPCMCKHEHPDLHKTPSLTAVSRPGGQGRRGRVSARCHAGHAVKIGWETNLRLGSGDKSPADTARRCLACSGSSPISPCRPRACDAHNISAVPVAPWTRCQQRLECAAIRFLGSLLHSVSPPDERLLRCQGALP